MKITYLSFPLPQSKFTLKKKKKKFLGSLLQ